MGTLFDQAPRDYLTVTLGDVEHFLRSAIKTSKITGVTLDQTLKAWEILEMERQNSLAAINGDIHDEQMAGFGELLEKFTN